MKSSLRRGGLAQVSRRDHVTRYMPSRSEVHLEAGLGPQPHAPGPPLPDHLLPFAIVGDFSGRAHRGAGDGGPPLGARARERVDRDTVDQALARFAPEVAVALEGPSGATVTVRFAALDDFHPDTLLVRLPVFAALHALAEPTARPARARPGAPGPPVSPLDLVDRGDLLDRAVAATMGEAAGTDALQAFARRLAEPHLIRDAAPSARARQAGIDAASGDLLRTMLHAPGVRALEALWRAVDFLVRRVDGAAEPPFYLVDVSQDAAATDLAAGAPEQSALAALLGNPPGGRWGAILSDYVFRADPAHADLAGRLAALARSLGAPWIAAADPSLAGCPSLLEHPDPAEWDQPVPAAWGMLRRRPEAAWLGLVLPRVLLRVPYGPDTEPCERLAWHETDETPRHDAYLWGSPAFACGLLLAERLGPGGTWRTASGVLDIGDMPLHVHPADGAPRAQPCAELVLGERAGHRLLDVGLMPLMSLKDRDVVRLLRFQSFAEPVAPLAGAWIGRGRA
jgi:type VI secretion system protein ImpC